MRIEDPQISEYTVAYAELTRRRSRRGQPPAPRIVAEGDSWFRGPNTGIVSKLSYRLGVPILNLADGGDTITKPAKAGKSSRRKKQAMTGKKQMRRLRTTFKSVRPDVLMLSGGGNDLLQNAERYIYDGFGNDADVAKVINSGRLDSILDDIVEGIAEIAEVAIESNANVRILLHQYSVPQAVGRSQRILFWRIGPWFSEILNDKCVTGDYSEERAKEVVEYLMRSFGKRIEVLCSDTTNHFNFVPTIEVLNEKKDWEDELHPSDTGGDKLAQSYVKWFTTQFEKSAKSD